MSRLPFPQGHKYTRFADETLTLDMAYRESQGGAIQDLYRYQNELKAEFAFHLSEAGDFYSNEDNLSGWKTPEAWTYRSPIASEFAFACAQIRNFPREDMSTFCTARARYGEFISIFSAPLTTSTMTLQNMEQILREIDANMEKYLK